MPLKPMFTGNNNKKKQINQTTQKFSTSVRQRTQPTK